MANVLASCGSNIASIGRNTNKKLKMITLKNSRPGEPLLLHDEPIFLKNKIVGRTTSGCFSFNFNKNLSFGYINSGMSHKDIESSEFEIEVEKIKYKASILEAPLNNKNLSKL